MSDKSRHERNSTATNADKKKTKASNRLVRGFGYCVNKLWLLLALTIIFVALMHVLLSLFLPEIDRYRPEIVNWIENQYQLEIEVKQITAEWGAYGPVLELQGLKVKSNKRLDDILEVGKVAIYFDLVTSLRNWQISTREIAIDKADLTFFISQTLGVELKSANTGDSDINIDNVSSRLFDILFGQRQALLSDSTLTLVTQSGSEFSYHVNQLNIQKYQNAHQLVGELEDRSFGKIKLIVEVFGDPSSPQSYSEIYMQGENISIAALPWSKNAPIEPPQAGELGWQFWGTWKDKHWVKASANLSLNNARWGSPGEHKTINKFQTKLFWIYDKLSDGYLVAHHSQVENDGNSPRAISDIFLSYQRASSASAAWNLTVDEFSLSSIVPYVNSLINNKEPGTQFLTQSEISLDLKRLHIVFPKSLNVWQKPELSFSFSGLQYNRWQSIPRLNGLSGMLYLKGAEGSAALSARETQMELGEMFRDAIKVNQIEALVNWSKEAGSPTSQNNNDEAIDSNWRVQLVNGKLNNDDLSLSASAEWFTQDNTSVFSLYTELTDFDLEKKSLYLPVSIMSPDVVSRLDGSVKKGASPIIQSVVRGPVSSFPFDGAEVTEGYFAALGYVTDATYQFSPDWPEATHLNSKLLFVGNAMDIVASRAEILGNKTNYAHAFVRDLSGKDPVLALNLKMESTNNSARLLLSQSPLVEISESLSGIDFTGTQHSFVDLKIRLNAPPDSIPEVQGTIKFNPKSANVKTPFIELENLDGVIKFDQNSLLKSSLKANYKGSPFSISLIGQQENDDPELTIEASGLISESGISDFLDPRWSQFFVGESLVTTSILFSPSSNPGSVTVEVSSDLKGMSILLPGTLRKAAKETSEFLLNLDFSEYSKGNISWNGISGDWYWGKMPTGILATDSLIKAELEIASTGDELSGEQFVGYGAHLFVNKPFQYEPLEPGIRLLGELASANLVEWIDFVNKLNNEPRRVGVEAGLQPMSKAKRKENLLINALNFDIASFNMGTAALGQTKISLSKASDQPWSVDLDSSGTKLDLIMYDNKPWKMEISKLDLTFEDTPDSKENVSSNPLMPKDMFDLDLKCDECVFQGKRYGKILAEIRNADGTVSYRGTIKKGKQHGLAFSGTWKELLKPIDIRTEIEDKTNATLISTSVPTSVPGQANEEHPFVDQAVQTGETHAAQNSLTETRIRFVLSTNDVGGLLERWNINPSVKDSAGRLIAEMSWQDAPWNFDYSHAKANAQLHLKRGYLSDISDGQGRIFSLFNLQSLIRKITFDFKDVYQKGFFFDSIDGTLQLDGGVVSTENVSIIGNVANVKLFGRTNIKDETIEQLAIISPHLTSSLPVLAAWAIEPTTGLIIYLINKIMEPAVEVATQIDYRIHGTFDEVIVDQLRSSKKKIKVEYETEVPSTLAETTADNTLKSDTAVEGNAPPEGNQACDPLVPNVQINVKKPDQRLEQKSDQDEL